MSVEERLAISREEAFISLLRGVKGVLDKHGVGFWLDSGTLLGAVRDGKFIPWEHDIDLATWETNLSSNARKLIAEGLSEKGFQVNLFRNKMDIQDRERAVWADLHYYRLIRDEAIELRLEPVNLLGQAIVYLSQVLSAPGYFEVDLKRKSSIRDLAKNVLVRTSRKLPSSVRTWLARIPVALLETKIGCKDVSWVIPAAFFTDLTTVTFYEMEVRIPSRKEEFLALRFGDDWRIPRRDWVANRDDGGIVGVRSARKVRKLES